MNCPWILTIFLTFTIIQDINPLVFNHNYYLGTYENRSSMDILFSRSQTSTSEKDSWLSETLTYPLNLGPYGGKILAIHVQVTQTTTLVGRLYITEGRIGGTRIEMIVEADYATLLTCNYTVYGEKPFTRKKRVKFPMKQRTRLRDDGIGARDEL